MAAKSLSTTYMKTLVAQACATGTIIQERFPGRVMLTPAEVAEVWRGSRSREAMGAIRKQLSRGTLVPRTKKNGGEWEIPVEKLIKAIERLGSGDHEDEGEECGLPSHRQAAPLSGTRRRALSPRMSDTVGFWDEVFTELDRLQAQWRQAALSGQAIYGWTRVSAEQRKAQADKVVGGTPRSTYTDDDAAKLCGRDIRTLRRWRKEKDGPAFRTKKVKNNVVIVYPRSALLKWLKSNPKEQLALDVMVWSMDAAGRVARTGERDAGSLLDLLQAEHASRESLAVAMTLYRQQVADELDAAAWKMAKMPEETEPEQRRVF